MPFVYCLNTSTIQPQPLLGKIRLAGEHGFQAVELWLNDIFAYLEAGGRLADVTKAVSDAGLTVASTIAMKGWGDASEGAYPAVLDDCRRRIELASRLGSPYVVATPPRGIGSLPLIAKRYRDLLAIGREFGVRPAMEYLGFCQSVFRIDQALWILEQVDSPDATLVLDSFHTFRGGSSLSDVRAVPVERIAHFHLDDAPAHPPREEQLDPDRVLPGDGILDLPAEIETLKQKGYRGAISLELFNPGWWERDPHELLDKGMERMRMLLE